MNSVKGGKKIKVGVIGAGAAGLCAARHLAQSPNQFEFVVFEQTAEIGGTWVYSDKTDSDDDTLPIHTSMYKNLRTNLPKEIMKFPDYCEITGSVSCVSHTAILDYLKNYANNFHLRRFIKFNTTVEKVQLKQSGAVHDLITDEWIVTVKDLNTATSEVFIFDAIIVCNGHYFNPYIPSIQGLENFRGQILHSHNYRTPEIFAGKKILVLGASSSGIDIALELCDRADKKSHVYLSHNNERLSKDSLHNKMTEVQGISSFTKDQTFLLKDGSSVRADVLIFCTGYNYSYPFLDKSCDIHVEDNHVFPLYKHLINAHHPTMCFIGIPMAVVPFPMFHMQVRYFLSLLENKAELPSKSVRMEDSKLHAAQIKRHAHKFGYLQWKYNDDLARAGGFERLPSYYKRGYEAWSELKWYNLREYKQFNLELNSTGDSVRVVKA